RVLNRVTNYFGSHGCVACRVLDCVDTTPRSNKYTRSVERKEMFKSSKEMNMVLEAVEKQWANYEVNAKVAEEEENIVLVEWGRIKDFISSIKGKI
ncbi:hypothetical protein Gohar_027446, partial [Gossypium harknessii]|nr:hypothetical protein [Gossypium harknessii]